MFQFIATLAAILFGIFICCAWKQNREMHADRERKAKQLAEDLRSGKRSWMSVGLYELGDW